MKVILPSTLAICLFFSSCKKENVDGLKQLKFDESFFAHQAEKVLLKNESSSLTLELKTLIDDRCSSHSVCTDEGKGVVKIKLSNVDNSTSETMLAIGNSEENQIDTISLRLDKKFFVLKLLSITPKPSENNQKELKAAEFLIKEIVR